MPPPPLVSARWRPSALTAVAISVGVTLWLAIATYDASTTRFDTWAVRSLTARIGLDAAAFLRDLSEPGLSLAVIVLVGLAAALARRWSLLILAAVGPGVAVVLTEYVLKPLVGRYVSIPGVPAEVARQLYSGAYPSGHETGVTAAAVLVLVACGQVAISAAGRTAIVVALGGWVGLAAVGLVRNFYHYATDTIGAVGLSVAIVLGGALAIDGGAAILAARAGERREPARVSG